MNSTTRHYSGRAFVSPISFLRLTWACAAYKIVIASPASGAPLAATIEPIEGVTTKLSARVPPRLKIPATAFLRLDDPRGALKSGKLKSKLEFCPRCVLPFDRLPQHERLVRWHFI